MVAPGMHVQVNCRKNYTKTPGTPSSGAEVFDRRTRTSSGGSNFKKGCVYCCCVIREREKRKLRNRVSVSCNNQDVDKTVHQVSASPSCACGAPKEASRRTK